MSTHTLHDHRELRKPSSEAEAARIMQICNACRYCEGFCASFGAMTRRLDFAQADLHYLANLCHNCGACLHACQYAPPHEFAVNVPQSFANLRQTTYTQYAFPRRMGAVYERQGLLVALALAIAVSLLLCAALMMNGSLWGKVSQGNFYAIFPHGLMVGLFGPVFLFVVLALGIGLKRFLGDIQSATGSLPATIPDRKRTAQNILSLKYLDGGHGEGCHNESEAWTQSRRWAHHLTFYGFMLCLAATSVATLYHYAFSWQAPYPWYSLPKILGILGGLSLMIGTTWLAKLRTQRHPLHGSPTQEAMDWGFIALLWLTASTGLALMLLRTSAALPLTLAIHLGVVLALFLTMPYGKFAHGIYRGAALLRFHVEKRLPPTHAAGE
jgi:citrate/tricarballylate utilization protein